MVSCAYILRPKGMKHLHTGRYTGLDTIINIDGYYINYYTSKYRFRGIMFYRDGSVQFQIRDFYQSEDKYVENVIENKQSKKIGNPYWGGWGSYQQLSDSLIEVTTSLWYDKVSRIESTTSVFKILDENHLLQIDGWNCNENPFEFRLYLNRPDSTNWLLEKEWFWKRIGKE